MNCKDKNGFGRMTFVINGVDYDIPSHHLMERYVDVFEEGDSLCMSNLVPLDIEMDG